MPRGGAVRRAILLSGSLLRDFSLLRQDFAFDVNLREARSEADAGLPDGLVLRRLKLTFMFVEV